MDSCVDLVNNQLEARHVACVDINKIMVLSSWMVGKELI